MNGKHVSTKIDLALPASCRCPSSQSWHVSLCNAFTGFQKAPANPFASSQGSGFGNSQGSGHANNQNNSFANSQDSSFASNQNHGFASSQSSGFINGNAVDVIARRRALLERSHTFVDAVKSEIKTAPVFTETVRACAADTGSDGALFSQYDMIAGDAHHPTKSDEMFYYNVAAPSSTFICGSQGSGKSHTLSCLLENCLFSNDANQLPRPLTGIVFHYDTFTSDDKGSPCEAAHLASNPNVKVRVLCAPTNIGSITRTYSNLPVTVEPLRIREKDLNTKRMGDLMAVKVGGSMPLYMHTVNRILRELRIQQQQTPGAHFNYRAFRGMLNREDLTEHQRVPLDQRLDNLESFMATKGQIGNDWTAKAGQLTIVDLSCPCVTPEGACQLFNICLSLFLEQHKAVGRVVALDEAHKYMNESGESSALTENLLGHDPPAAAPGHARRHLHAGADHLAPAAGPVLRDHRAPVHFARVAARPAEAPRGRVGGRLGPGGGGDDDGRAGPAGSCARSVCADRAASCGRGAHVRAERDPEARRRGAGGEAERWRVEDPGAQPGHF